MLGRLAQVHENVMARLHPRIPRVRQSSVGLTNRLQGSSNLTTTTPPTPWTSRNVARNRRDSATLSGWARQRGLASVERCDVRVGDLESGKALTTPSPVPRTARTPG